MGDAGAILVFLVLPVVVTLRAVTGVLAVLLAPVAAMVIAAAAAVAHIWLGVPVAQAWAFLVLGATIFVWVPRRSREQALANARGGWGAGEVAVLILFAIVLLVMTRATPYPLYWDARSIWLFHASWLIEPVGVWVEAQTEPALAFAHPNYPPLGPASVAVVWGLAGGGENLLLGARLLTALAISTMGVVVILLHRAHGARRARALVGPQWLLMAATAATLGGGYLTDGYMDVLQAALVGAVLATLLLAQHWGGPGPVLPLLVVLGVAASLAKQEGAWFCAGVMLAYLVSIGVRAGLRAAWILAVPLAALVLWQLTVRVLGGYNQSDADGVVGRLPELAALDSTGWEALRTIATLYAWQLGTLVGLVALASLGLLLARDRHRARPAAVLIAGSAVVLLVIVILTFALGETRTALEGWLVNSLYRISATPGLVAWIGVAVAVAYLAGGVRPTAPPPGRSPHDEEPALATADDYDPDASPSPPAVLP